MDILKYLAMTVLFGMIIVFSFFMTFEVDDHIDCEDNEIKIVTETTGWVNYADCVPREMAPETDQTAGIHG